MSEVNRYLRAETSQALTAAALSYTTTFASNWQLSEVHLKASTNITETVTCTFASRTGSSYNVTLDTSNLSSSQNYVFRPSGNCVFMDGDELRVTCTAANGTGTVYVNIIGEPYGHQPVTATSNPRL